MTSQTALLQPSQLACSMPVLESGDVGVVVKPDGSFQVFSSGMAGIDESNMTEEQRQQGKRLIALAVALNSPDMIETLVSAACDDDVYRQDRIIDYGSKH